MNFKKSRSTECLNIETGADRYLLHGPGLGSRADSGHRQTHVDSWTDTLVEQLGLQENLRQTDGKFNTR